MTKELHDLKAQIEDLKLKIKSTLYFRIKIELEKRKPNPIYQLSMV